MGFVSGPASRAAMIKLVCPHCGTAQLRARAAQHYRCTSCHKSFTRAEGERAARAAKR